jgi:YbgC/YbaW family acyl-CoA thioester hydrolase
MPKADFKCVHRLRVRWAEVDMQKVVFNGHYLTYLDTTFAEYFRAIGLAYPDGYVDKYANDIFLRKTTIEHLGSAHYDDELSVLCRVAKLGRTSLTFAFEIHRDKLLLSAELVYVNVEVPSMKPAPLPADLRERVRAYEPTAPLES